MKTSFANSLKKFHQNEEGLEPLQIVMIVAVGAILLVLMTTLGKNALNAMGEAVMNVISGDG